MRPDTCAVLLALTLAAPGSEALTVERWGTLREVLRDGRTEARVAVSELERPGAVGLGALAGLGGEILVLDGEAWVTRAAPEGDAVTTRAAADDRATFAAVSDVAAWSEHVLPRDLSLSELEEHVGRLAAEQGLDAGTFPFVVEGRVRDVDAHVLNGACPFASADPLPPEVAPRSLERRRGRGVLVGFLTDEPPGVIAHHGSRTHVHVLLDGHGRPGGHVDGITVRAGSILRLPAVDARGAD